VAFGSDDGPDFLDFGGFADEEGTADDAHVSAAHKLFFLPGAKFLDGFVGGIAEQGEIESVLFLERNKSFDGISAHAENGNTEMVELLLCVTKLGRFDRSTWSAGFGKEKEEDTLAGEVLERDFQALVGIEAKGGGFGAYFEHQNSFGVDLQSLPRIESGRSHLPGRDKLQTAPTIDTQYTPRCFGPGRNFFGNLP